jgi:uncharacterized protein
MTKRINSAQKFIIGIMKIYQKTLSLDHGWLGRLMPRTRHCRFIPSCSEYSIQAVEKYGILRGGWMGMKRVGRCTPWSQHDHWDPVK